MIRALALIVFLLVSACGRLQVPHTPQAVQDPSDPAPVIPEPQSHELGFNLAAFAAVDRLKGRQELMTVRPTANGPTRFADAIHQAIMLHEAPAAWSLGGNEGLFGLIEESGRSAVSLSSNPLCEHTVETLEATIGHAVPASVAEDATELARRWNALREDPVALRHLQSRLMGCLAYTESLTTADGTRSRQVALEHGPEGYEKPNGVKFYLDAAQTHPDSRLNIGLYQFSPASRGNIQACIRSWNAVHGSNASLQIDPRSDASTMIRRLGSASQDFNAFCGVDKIAQVFFVQVNTLNERRTHPANFITLPDGSHRLKEPRDRCVSLHFNGRAYNHFGPLQNSTRRNLSELLSCVLHEE